MPVVDVIFEIRRLREAIDSARRDADRADDHESPVLRAELQRIPIHPKRVERSTNFPYTALTERESLYHVSRSCRVPRKSADGSQSEVRRSGLELTNSGG